MYLVKECDVLYAKQATIVENYFSKPCNYD